MTRPILLSSCARAATAAEAKFRLTYPLAPSRAVRVVGLDPTAVAVVQAAAEESWNQARFYSATLAGGEPQLVALDGDRPAGSLAGELDGVDSVLMVAADAAGSELASVLGAACVVRGIMTAGLILPGQERPEAALTALRPYARMLLVPGDRDDLVELLRAIRA